MCMSLHAVVVERFNGGCGLSWNILCTLTIYSICFLFTLCKYIPHMDDSQMRLTPQYLNIGVKSLCISYLACVYIRINKYRNKSPLSHSTTLDVMQHKHYVTLRLFNHLACNSITAKFVVEHRILNIMPLGGHGSVSTDMRLYVEKRNRYEIRMFQLGNEGLHFRLC